MEEYEYQLSRMLEMYQRFTAKLTNTLEMKTILKAIWADLPQGPINAAILPFRKRSQACIKLNVAGGHFEHAV